MRMQSIVGIRPCWLIVCDRDGTTQELLIGVAEARAIADRVNVPDVSDFGEADDSPACREIAECVAVVRGWRMFGDGTERWQCPGCAEVHGG